MLVLPPIEAATWFALGYAAVLLGVAYGIDRLARRAATTVERQRCGGFRYHADHDAWVCPQDHWLWPHSFDPENRVMRYRGRSAVCNSCPVRDTCTTSDSGREVQRQVDPWPASESARFHRGIACTVAVLAAVWPLALAVSAATSASDPVNTWILVAATVAALLASPAVVPPPSDAGRPDRGAMPQHRRQRRRTRGGRPSLSVAAVHVRLGSLRTQLSDRRHLLEVSMTILIIVVAVLALLRRRWSRSRTSRSPR